jgi:hypothetical protein
LALCTHEVVFGMPIFSQVFPGKHFAAKIDVSSMHILHEQMRKGRLPHSPHGIDLRE